MRGKRWLAAFLAALCVGMPCLLPASAASSLAEENVKAPAAVLMEAESGKVLYEKAPHEKRACASVTKVMTLLLVMEALESGKLTWTETLTASAHAASMGGSDIWLEEGEQMTVEDLVKATVVASANDAAVVLAEAVAGSEEAFVQQMNARAKELGMQDTTFKNCNGLDEEGHLTSAYDVALMSRALLLHKEILNYTTIWMDTLRCGKTQLVNTNKLLRSYDGITGLKTGTTSQAGSCISATAQRGDLSLIAVVLGASTTQDRFSTARTLLDYGFDNWSMEPLPQPETPLTAVKVRGGMQPEVAVSADLSGSMLVPKEEAGKAVCTVELQTEVEAPVQKGQQLGQVLYTLGEETLCTRPILAQQSIEAQSLSRIFALLLQKVFSI